MFELIDRKCQYEKLSKIGFLQHNNIISYKYVSKKDISSAFNTITFVKYKGFNFFVENSSEGKFILRPLEEAMKYFKDFQDTDMTPYMRRWKRKFLTFGRNADQ